MSHVAVSHSSSNPGFLYASKASTQCFSAKALSSVWGARCFFSLLSAGWAMPSMTSVFSMLGFSQSQLLSWLFLHSLGSDIMASHHEFPGGLWIWVPSLFDCLPSGLPRSTFTKGSVWLRNAYLFHWCDKVSFANTLGYNRHFCLEYHNTEGNILIQWAQEVAASLYQVPGWKQMFQESQRHQDSC